MKTIAVEANRRDLNQSVLMGSHERVKVTEPLFLNESHRSASRSMRSHYNYTIFVSISQF